MRIGYLGFTENADIIIPPPSEVTYTPGITQRSETTVMGLSELKNYISYDTYTIQLTWKDIPEQDLAILSFIPAKQPIVLVDQANKEHIVVLDEPPRAMLAGVSTRSGKPLYSVSMTAYSVQGLPSKTQRLIETQSTVLPNSITVPNNPTPRNQTPPSSPTPMYSPIKLRAKNGLPPTAEFSTSARFTFLGFIDGFIIGIYPSNNGYIKLQKVTQSYPDWYSNVSSNKTVVGVLQQFPWKIDEPWTIGMLVYVDSTLSSGYILQGWGNNGLLDVMWQSGQLDVSLHIDNKAYTRTFPLNTGVYTYIGLKYDGTNFYAGLNGALNNVISYTVAPLSSTRNELSIGGGPAYIDDLLISTTSTVDINQVYQWLVV